MLQTVSGCKALLPDCYNLMCVMAYKAQKEIINVFRQKGLICGRRRPPTPRDTFTPDGRKSERTAVSVL